MSNRKTSLSRRLTRKILIWAAVIIVGLAFFVFSVASWATREFYVDSYHNKMLITTEYTRRVLSDVYVAVTNNIYYIERDLDDPSSHKDVMVRIVKSGTRVRSCGISFIESYYPERGRLFCPYAWRNPAKPDVVSSVDLGDTGSDYLTADWFCDFIDKDTTVWSDPFYDGYEGKIPLSAYMAPIHDKTGRTVAVLGADVSLDWLTNKLNEMDSTINKNASFVSSVLKLSSVSYIVNHDGSFITHPDPEQIKKGNFLSHIESCGHSDVARLTENLEQGKTSIEESQMKFLYDGRECYVFYTPVKYTRWMIVTVVPWQSIDVLGFINGLVLLVVMTLVLLLIVWISYYYIKNATEALRMMIKPVNDMAKGNFSSPLPEVRKNDEIGQLRDALDEMQYSLSNYVNELKQH